MTNNYDIIRKEIFNLCKKYSSNDKNEDINRTVDNQIKKLPYMKSQVPPVLQIELELESKMKKNGSPETSITEMRSFIRKIQNLSIQNPISLIYFLSTMSNMGSESIDSISTGRSTIRTASQIEMRTSTPIGKENNFNNILPNSDISSISSIRSLALNDNLSNRFSNEQITVIESQRNNANVAIPKSSHNYQVSNELSEFTVIGELLFMILGNEGMHLVWSPFLHQLSIRNGSILPSSMYSFVLNICQCGSAYRKIRAYIDNGINNLGIGVVYQGLCVALNDYLSSYISLVASLQSQYNIWATELDRNCTSSQNYLSLEILLLKLHEPMSMLFFLSDLIDQVGDLRGGQLASVIYDHIFDGGFSRPKMVRNLLIHAVTPFYDFIQQWIYDGILEESYEEFFVAINYNFEFNQSWTEKYALRTHMIPNFITSSQAEKILLAGKSINFLREVCNEKPTFRDRKEVADTMKVTAQSMFNQIGNRSFDNMINTVFVITGEHLLKVMFEKYQLKNHLKALRKYMLHGQGDFILRMIEIIGGELSKPADELKESHMGGSLEMVIKSTNAQYDSRDILDRVHISFMRIAENESGWDIFTLNYHINDIKPLHAVINRNSFSCYLRAFNILFRSRRVHFILSGFNRGRNSAHRAFSTIPDVSSVLRLSHVLVVDMLHFVSQIQYHINFEVLECSWRKFMDSIKKATDLDSVMKHHEYFLKQVTSRCLLEPDSRELLSNLRTIYELIISFESLLTDMFSKFHDELRFRQAYQDRIIAMKKQGTWGVNDGMERKENERISTFTMTDVVRFQNKMKAFNNQYESHLMKFLSRIVNHQDCSLKRLYANLDFNGIYRDRLRKQSS